MNKILIIEQDETWFSVIEKLLRSRNFQVLWAKDSGLGLKLAKEQRPDLIISDVTTPKRQECQVLKQIREDSSIAQIPFIFLTADTDSESRYCAKHLGANDYILKHTKFNT